MRVLAYQVWFRICRLKCLLFGLMEIFLLGIVSCDNDTYTHSRLRQLHFRDVPVKELKGLKEIGVIREYTEDSSHISFVAFKLAKSNFPIIARERSGHLNML